MKFKGIGSLLYLCSLLGVTVSSSVHAINLEQQAVSTLPKTALNTKLANKTDGKSELRDLLSLFTNMKASFSQQIFDLQGEELQNSIGQLILQKPQMLRWTVTSPEESVLIADGKTVFSVDPFVEQVTLMDQSSLTETNPLMLLISNDSKQWDNVSIEKVDGDYLVRSLDEDAVISLVILSFNNQNQLSLLTSIDRQQQRNVIAFNNVEMNFETNDNTFAFAPNPAWVIDDQRVK